MERNTETYNVDTIKHHHNQWGNDLLRNDDTVIQRTVYGGTLDLDGPVTVELDEYFTTITGDMKVTVSYVEREYEGETYTEDYQIESVEVFA